MHETEKVLSTAIDAVVRGGMEALPGLFTDDVAKRTGNQPALR